MERPTPIKVAAGVEMPNTSAVSAPGSSRASSSRPTPQAPSRRSTRRTTLPSPIPTRAPSLPPPGCPICCDDSPDAMSALMCGHAFCTMCWESYITSKVREEGECNIRCMATDCNIAVPETFIKDLVNKETGTRYHELIMRDFVSHMDKLKYCPAPACSYTISCPQAANRASLTKFVPIVTCREGHSFCFGCTIDSDHRPVVCAAAAMWLKKCQDDSETANWIKSNTKECPKCQSTIEKNGGCKCVLVFLEIRSNLLYFSAI
jgi:ariadne-1